MGEIDDAHDAENERQSGRQQKQHDAELDAIEKLFQRQRHRATRTDRSIRKDRSRATRIPAGKRRLPAGPIASQLAVLRVGVAVVRQDLADRLDDRLAVGILLDPRRVPVLDRMLVGPELESAAHRLEVRFQHRGAERIGIGHIAIGRLQRGRDRERRVIALAGVIGRQPFGAELLLPRRHELLVGRIVEVGIPLRTCR